MPDRVTVGVRIRPLNARELASPRSHPAWRANPSSSTILSVPVPPASGRTPRSTNSGALSPAVSTLPSSSSTSSSFSSSSTTTTSTTSTTTTTTTTNTNNATTTAFRYDAVFGTASSNADVYTRLVSPLVNSVLHENLTHGTVFAYGQTSSGKTHTMLGHSADPGIVARTIADIFALSSTHNNIVVSYVEIYNERIRDLLSPHTRATCSATTAGASASASDLVLRDDGAGHVHLVGVTLVPVQSESKALEVLYKGQGARRVAGTRMNATSSRSHAIFTLHFVKSGAQLTLVDLAGSERAAATSGCTSGTSNCSGGSSRSVTVSHPNTRLQEGAHINQSLLVLGSIISRLSKSSTSSTTTDKKKTSMPASIAHLPFRDSKLTRLLRPALSGHGRTVVLCNVTPALAFFDETLSTLKFANRAKNLPVKPNGDAMGATQKKRMGAEFYRAKYDEVSQEVARLRAQFRDLEQEVVALRAASTTSSGGNSAAATAVVAAAVTAAASAAAVASTTTEMNSIMKKKNDDDVGKKTGTAAKTNVTEEEDEGQQKKNDMCDGEKEENMEKKNDETIHTTTTTTLTTTASLTLSVQASVHSETSSSSPSPPRSSSHFTPPPQADIPTASPVTQEQQPATNSPQRSPHHLKQQTNPESIATAINFDTDSDSEDEQTNHDQVHDSPRVSLCSRSTCNATSSPCSPPPPLPPLDDDDTAGLGGPPAHEKLHAEVRQLRGRIAGVEQENKRLTQRFLNMVTGYKSLQIQACKLRSGVARIGKRPHRHLLGIRGGGVGSNGNGSGGNDDVSAVVVGKRGCDVDNNKTAEIYESRYGSITSKPGNDGTINASVNIHNHNHYHMISVPSSNNNTSSSSSPHQSTHSIAKANDNNKTRRRNTAVIQRVTLSSMLTTSGTLSMDPTIGAATALALHLADLFREQQSDDERDHRHLRLSPARNEGDERTNNMKNNAGVFAPLVNLIKSMFGGGGGNNGDAAAQ